MSFDFQQIYDFLAPILTGVAGWLAGRQKRRNDFLSDLQSSVNLLSQENKNLLAEVVELRRENAELLSGQLKMQTEMESLKLENEQMRIEIEQLNEKLSGVKTITRTKV